MTPVPKVVQNPIHLHKIELLFAKGYDSNSNYIASFNALKHSYYNNDVQKNENGKYFCGDIIYDKLIGTRDEVWNCKAYKTSGGLTKSEFVLNQRGKIVSKKKSVTEIQLDRFKQYGINK